MTLALYIVMVAMLFQQAMSYMAAQVLPNVAPQAGAALALDPEMVLYHTTLFYAFSGVFQASVGGLIIRWGAIRASQISLLGLAIGLGGGVLVGHAIRGLLFDVDPFDLRVLVSSAILCLAAAVVACGLPAWRAGKVDPLDALRTD